MFLNKTRHVKLFLSCFFIAWIFTARNALSDGTTLSSPSSLPQPTFNLNLQASQSRPHISSVSYGQCFSQGDVLKLSGNGFGTSPAGRTLQLTANNTSIILSVVSWSDTRIDVKVSQSSLLKQNYQYAIGMRAHDGVSWASNLQTGIVSCNQSVNTQQNEQLPASVSKQGSELLQEDGQNRRSNPDEQRPHPADFSGSLLSQGQAQMHDAPDESTNPESEPGELLLSSDSMQQAQQLQALLAQSGFRIIRRKTLSNIGIVLSTYRIPEKMPLPAALKIVRNVAPSIQVDANHRYALQGAENNRYAHTMIGWPEKNANCNRQAVIGIVDTAIEQKRLSQKKITVTARSFVSNGYSKADHPHGELVAQLLVGEHGLLSAASVYSADVFRKTDDSKIDTTSEWLIRALDWLAGNRVNVVNMSLGGQRNMILESVINRMVDQGISIVAAAGNNGPAGPAMYPAAHERVIAVTAVDASRRVYRQANHGNYIDIAAPGVDIAIANPAGGLRYYSGTSYATPFVTAAIAVADRKKYSAIEIEQNLMKAAQDLGEKGRDNIYGAGLLQLVVKCR